MKHILRYEGDEIEVVVSNNASTDNTLELLYNISDPRLKIYSNENNIGSRNWPLALSRAVGEWAALMSDEDIVQIDELPCFISLLKKAVLEDVGVVTYSFPPLSSYWSGEYLWRTGIESFHAGFRHSGHITGHILNMAHFELANLDDYWNIRRKGYDDEEYKGKVFVCEPQQENLVRISMNHRVMITDHSLCMYGKDEGRDVVDHEKIDRYFWGGLSADYREMKVASFLDKLLARTGDDKTQYTCAMLSVYEMMIVAASSFYMGVVTGKHKYRPSLFKIAKSELGYTHNDAKQKTLEHVDSLMRNFPPNENEKFFSIFRYYLCELINNRLPKLEIEQFDFPLRVALGHTLFITLVQLNYVVEYNEKENINVGEFYDYEDDPFEIINTDKMIADVAQWRFDELFSNYTDVKTIRAHYIRGSALLRLKRYDEAETELKQFIERIEKPRDIRDIITGCFSVHSTYYYLGYIRQQKNDMGNATEYFQKAAMLANQLLMDMQLLPNRLNLPKDKRVLLLGRTGFIGGSLKRQLSLKYFTHAPFREDLDLLDPEAVRMCLKANKYDVIVHLATPTSQNPVDKPEELFERSLKIFSNLASCSDLYGKMIYIGSGAEYGKHRDIASISEEEFGGIIPHDTYGLSRYIMNEISSGKENIINLRLFGCCGAGDPEYKLMQYIAKSILENQSLKLREDRYMDYLYVEDILPVLEHFIDNDAKYKVYNLCSGDRMKVSEIAVEIKVLLGSDVEIEFEKNDPGFEYTGSNMRLRNEIPDWKPTPMREAIKKTLLKENII